jgi:hypothetical protein
MSQTDSISSDDDKQQKKLEDLNLTWSPHIAIVPWKDESGEAKSDTKGPLMVVILEKRVLWFEQSWGEEVDLVWKCLPCTPETAERIGARKIARLLALKLPPTVFFDYLIKFCGSLVGLSKKFPQIKTVRSSECSSFKPGPQLMAGTQHFSFQLAYHKFTLWKQKFICLAKSSSTNTVKKILNFYNEVYSYTFLMPAIFEQLKHPDLVKYLEDYNKLFWKLIDSLETFIGILHLLSLDPTVGVAAPPNPSAL